MDNERLEETRDVLALLILTLANPPITDETLRPLLERLGKDWNVVERRVRNGTGPLKPRPLTVRKVDEGDYSQT